MPKDNGKVIVSLLAGATAGIVAGLLLAPETGDELRKSLREAAGKWGGSLGKLAQDTLNKLQQNQPGHTNPDAAVSEDRHAADALFDSMSSKSNAAEPGDLTTSATGNGRSVGGDDQPADQNTLDYDGDGSDGRHRGIV
jgi:gas vesicle protein